MSNLYHNERIWYINAFVSGLYFLLPVRFFFFTQELWFSVEFAAVVSVIDLWVMTLLEIPTWTRADKYWRKRMFILWNILMTLGLFPYVLTTNPVVIIAWVVLTWGWMALQSWTFDPMVFEEFKANNDEASYKRYTRRDHVILFGSRMIGCVVWAYLYTINPLYAYYWAICTFWISVLLWCLVKELPYEKELTRTSLREYTIDWRNHLTGSSILRTLLTVFIGTYIAWNMMRTLYQYFFDQLWTSILLIWVIYAWLNLFSMLWSKTTKYFYTWVQSLPTIYRIVFILVAVGLAIIGFVPWLWIIAWVVCFQMYFWMYNPVVFDVVQQQIPTTHRSTSMSILSCMDSLAATIASSLAWVLVVWLWQSWLSVVLLVLVGGIYLRTHKHNSAKD